VGAKRASLRFRALPPRSHDLSALVVVVVAELALATVHHVLKRVTRGHGSVARRVVRILVLRRALPRFFFARSLRLQSLRSTLRPASLSTAAAYISSHPKQRTRRSVARVAPAQEPERAEARAQKRDGQRVRNELNVAQHNPDDLPVCGLQEDEYHCEQLSVHPHADLVCARVSTCSDGLRPRVAPLNSNITRLSTRLIALIMCGLAGASPPASIDMNSSTPARASTSSLSGPSRRTVPSALM
jgi:hypothetical protein